MILVPSGRIIVVFTLYIVYCLHINKVEKYK
jgi:hypothetical protein